MDLKEQQADMSKKEIDFLIEEYKTAWQMILNIDERRGKFIQYYSFVFVGVIGLVVTLLKNVNLFKNSNPLIFSREVSASLLLMATAIAGVTIIYMLWTERKSNVRYRKKVNIIRGILLTKSKNSDIIEYLKHKQLGIKIAEDNDSIRPVGSTLTGIFLLIGIEIAILLVGAIFILSPWLIKIKVALSNLTNC